MALKAGQAVFSDYSHVYSPHKFTQPQLFACLVLKDFEKKDYRGVCQLLEDCTDLRDAIGLKTVPHYTTLQKASRRLLKHKHVRQLVDDTVRRIRKRSKTVKYAAADSSGFDAHHASRYFILRTQAYQKGKEPKKQTTYRHYGKLMLIVCTATHAILAAVASRGPTPDVAELDTVLMELAPSQKLKHLLADAGFDSAHNHALLREDHGISTIPPDAGRASKDPDALPTNYYRRLMKTRFNTKAYRKRPQAETVFSMLKRNLGSSLRGRTHWSRCRDLYLRALTHNIALALLRVFYRAGRSHFRSNRGVAPFPGLGFGSHFIPFTSSSSVPLDSPPAFSHAVAIQSCIRPRQLDEIQSRMHRRQHQRAGRVVGHHGVVADLLGLQLRVLAEVALVGVGAVPPPAGSGSIVGGVIVNSSARAAGNSSRLETRSTVRKPLDMSNTPCALISRGIRSDVKARGVSRQSPRSERACSRFFE